MFGFIRKPIENLLRRLILKDLKEVLLAVLTPLTQTKWGTKFLMAISAVGGMGYLVYSDKLDGLYGAIGMAIVAVAYFMFRDKQEERDKP